jgi:hypothetical protein
VLSQLLSKQTSDSSAFLNAKYLLKYVLNWEQHFSYFNPDYLPSGLTVTELARVYCTAKYIGTLLAEREEGVEDLIPLPICLLLIMRTELAHLGRS